MPKKMLIDATHAEETRVVVVEGNKVDEFDFESLNKRQLSGNIYLAKVTRVEPSLQAAFVDYGGNRHGFLSFAEIHPDYYQIPVADREALIAEEEAYTKSLEEEANIAQQKKSRIRKRKAKVIAEDANNDVTTSSDIIENLSETHEVVDYADGEKNNIDSDKSVHENENDKSSDNISDNIDPEITSDEPIDTDINDSVELEMDDTQSDNGIESVADDDIEEEVRPRKPRPRRYKIQEVIKVRQILLIQVVKEERGNKGAALTTYLSLAGRYCVLMPNTARGGGISRKITNVQDRKKIKEITSELDVPKGAGLIVRTAGAKRNRDDILRDYEYLMRQWTQIRDITLESIAPTQIYAEGDIIKRSIRDLYNNDIDEIIVEGERGFEAAKAYMTMLMPSHVKRVKQYKNKMPLYARYQVENYLGGMFNPTVQLKSGGYIVIGVTEALVAVDVNSGKATKESSIEKTALKTNLEAAKEVARQLRLRDVGGLVVIDFIDMLDTAHQEKVESAFRKAVYSDRARVQISGISKFGLLEVSRQRLRPSLNESYDIEHVLVRGPRSLGLSILRIIGEDSAKDNTGEIQVYVPADVASYLLNEKRQDIINIEKTNNIRVMVIADPYKSRPYYKVVRIKASDIKNIDSYKLTPNSPEPSSDWRDDKNQSKAMKPLVDGIKPPKMPKKKKEGLVGWIKSIAGIDKEEKPKKKTTRSNNQNRNKKPRQNSKPRTNNKGAAQKNTQRNPNQRSNPNQKPNPNQKNTRNQNTKNSNESSVKKANVKIDKPVEPKKVAENNATKSKPSEKTTNKKPVNNKPKVDKEPAIREIVKEPKAKVKIPTRASNDPRYKS
mgnify:CR=1 FL=1